MLIHARISPFTQSRMQHLERENLEREKRELEKEAREMETREIEAREKKARELEAQKKERREKEAPERQVVKGQAKIQGRAKQASAEHNTRQNKCTAPMETASKKLRIGYDPEEGVLLKIRHQIMF